MLRRPQRLHRAAAAALVLTMGSATWLAPATGEGSSPAARRTVGEVVGESGDLTVTGTWSGFDLETDDHDHANTEGTDGGTDGGTDDGQHGLLGTADGKAAMVHFAHAVHLERGATLTVVLRPRATKGGAPEFDVVRIRSVLPPRAEAKQAPDAEVTPVDPKGGALALAPAAPFSMLIIPVYCSHQSGSTTVFPMPTAPTQTTFENLVTSTVSKWFDQFSWHNRQFTPTATPWYDICPAWGQFPESPEALAALNGYNSATYKRVVIVGDYAGGGVLGAAENVPGKRMMIYGSSLDPMLWSHELGHLEGMFHANSLRCMNGLTPVIYTVAANCTSTEYGDVDDSLGQPLGYFGFSSAQADKKGWLGPANIRTVNATSKTLIGDYAGAFSIQPMRAVKLELPSGTYYVERRRAVGWDSGLSAYPGLTNGVQLRLVGGNVDSASFLSTQQSQPQLLDGTPATPTFNDAALPFNTIYQTPDGVKIWAAAMGGFAQVYVDWPVGLAGPSNPRNVQATVNSSTGMAHITWDPPALNPGGLTYEIRTSAIAMGGFTTTNNWIDIGPMPDGSSAVGVRAYSGANTSQYAGSNLMWSWPVPTTPNYTVLEGSNPLAGATVTRSVTVTLPWSPYGGASRNFGLYPGTALDGSDWVAAGQTVTFPANATTGTFSFQVYADQTLEPDEQMDIIVAEFHCPAMWFVPDCITPTPIATVTLVNDDP